METPVRGGKAYPRYERVKSQQQQKSFATFVVPRRRDHPRGLTQGGLLLWSAGGRTECLRDRSFRSASKSHTRAPRASCVGKSLKLYSGDVKSMRGAGKGRRNGEVIKAES